MLQLLLSYSPTKSRLVPTRAASCAHFCATPVQKWNSLQGGQVQYTDAAVGHQVTAGSLQLSS